MQSFALLLAVTAVARASIPLEAARLRGELPAAPVAPARTLLATNATSPPSMEGFLVPGDAIPLVNFTMQDSYAGRLPVTNTSDDARELFFWYWPSSLEGGSNQLTIWLNGGPGCSSLTGLLEENGPFLWLPGTDGPVLNPFAWSTASDMLYIDQPVGTGFSVGTVDISDEFQLSNEFYGFLTNFYTVFPDLVKKQLFITGESYAGYYVPFIASRILNQTDAEKTALPISLQGLLINDGVYSSFTVSENIPMLDFALAHTEALGLSTGDLAQLANISSTCGYDAVMNQLVYPPQGKLILPNAATVENSISCEEWEPVVDNALQVNPCFNVYRVTDTCPTPVDHLDDYFSRPDVQKLLHVDGFGAFSQCANNSVFIGNGQDQTPEFSEALFPQLIANIPRSLTLWHGLLDGILLANGTRITIQNLTWGGSQGFQSAPGAPLMLNGTQKGIYHTERGLTYIEVDNAGHMIPQDQPELALAVFRSVLGLDNSTLSNGGATTSNGGTSTGGSVNAAGRAGEAAAWTAAVALLAVAAAVLI